MSHSAETRSQRSALLILAAGVVALYYFVPYGRYLLYPFTLLSTWVHEMGHGLTALMYGGKFYHLELYANGAGLAMTSVATPFQHAMVAAGGLLAPAFIGGVLLAFGHKMARPLLWGFTASILLSCFMWVNFPIGWLILAPLLFLTLAISIWGKPAACIRTVQLYACVLTLDTMTRGINYTFSPAAYVDGQQRTSDIIQVAQVLPGHYYIWGAVIALLSLSFLLGGLWMAWRKKPTNGRTLGLS